MGYVHVLMDLIQPVVVQHARLDIMEVNVINVLLDIQDQTVVLNQLAKMEVQQINPISLQLVVLVHVLLDLLGNSVNYVIQQMDTVVQIALQIIVMEMELLLVNQMGYVPVLMDLIQPVVVQHARQDIQEVNVINVLLDIQDQTAFNQLAKMEVQ